MALELLRVSNFDWTMFISTRDFLLLLYECNVVNKSFLSNLDVRHTLFIHISGPIKPDT